MDIPGGGDEVEFEALILEALVPRADSIRAELQRLLRQKPFEKFVLTLENGDRAVIEHPENIAYDPRPKGSDEFYVLAGSVRLFSTFEAVSALALADREGAAA